jgi:hypothetical protein
MCVEMRADDNDGVWGLWPQVCHYFYSFSEPTMRS